MLATPGVIFIVICESGIFKFVYRPYKLKIVEGLIIQPKVGL